MYAVIGVLHSCRAAALHKHHASVKLNYENILQRFKQKNKLHLISNSEI